MTAVTGAPCNGPRHQDLAGPGASSIVPAGSENRHHVKFSRRQFLVSTLAVSAAFVGYRRLLSPALAEEARRLGYGPLLRDPAGVIDLPEGFEYRILSRAGDVMDDGLFVPGRPDSMAVFPGDDGRLVILRNHELITTWAAQGPFGEDNELLDKVARRDVYDYGGGDTPSVGGTTTLVYDPASGRLEKQFLSLAGTEINCSGGPTPWGTWISCEETVEKAGEHERDILGTEARYVHDRDHGYNFEVVAGERKRLTRPRPLTAMGRFKHEAVAVDPRTGIVYQTQDERDSLIYRFIPDRRGKLHKGGRLQALAFAEEPGRDTRNWPQGRGLEQSPVERDRSYPVRWIDLEDVDSPDDTLRLRGLADGAALFARGEGMWFGNGEVYWAATAGGPIGAGQIFRYRPSRFEAAADERGEPGTIELFYESHDTEVFAHVDNVYVAPWGDLICCEDSDENNSLLGMTPAGDIYRIANNPYTPSEFAGACFSPDGETLFVNLQDNHITLAIRGPWHHLRGQT